MSMTLANTSATAAASAREVSGTVRLTTFEIYAITILPPILRDLHDAHPRIRIELDTSHEVRDLAAERCGEEVLQHRGVEAR